MVHENTGLLLFFIFSFLELIAKTENRPLGLTILNPAPSMPLSLKTSTNIVLAVPGVTLP